MWRRSNPTPSSLTRIWMRPVGNHSSKSSTWPAPEYLVALLRVSSAIRNRASRTSSEKMGRPGVTRVSRFWPTFSSAWKMEEKLPAKERRDGMRPTWMTEGWSWWLMGLLRLVMGGGAAIRKFCQGGFDQVAGEKEASLDAAV